MDYLRKMLNRARALFKAMPPSQRYSIAALFASVVVSLAMLVTWNARESYSPVLSELTGPQMTAIQDALKGTDYDYRFRDGTLFVAGMQRDGLLMDLTEKGALPSDISASFGFEDLVEPQGFNMKTAEQQQMEYNIALGNMLARAISTAPEIARAQVTINSSRDGYFGPFHSSAAGTSRYFGRRLSWLPLLSRIFVMAEMPSFRLSLVRAPVPRLSRVTVVPSKLIVRLS